MSGLEAIEEDVAGTGEEDFETGMRQNAMERDAADADQDGKLDFNEFCQFVRDREEGEFTDEELRKRFDALDEDGSGKVDMAEYLLWSLKDALARSANRVVDLFRAWDEDKSGTVDCEEFHKAIRALGFEVERADSDAVFMSLDDDNSGSLEYKELAAMLRKGAGSEKVKGNLKRGSSQAADRSRGAKLTAKNINVNYQASRVAALPPMAKLEVGDKSIQEQLRDLLATNSVKLIDLFREWDDDGNGALDKKEMRRAIAALGYEAPKKEVDALFDSIDVDHSGWIEYEELKKALSEKGVKAAQKEHAAKLKKQEAEKKAVDGMVAEGDVAGTGEEDFETGMRQNAMERDAADADQDGKLDFNEFCQFVRDREEGEFTDEELRKRFDALDEDGSGKVDMAEYLLWSLKDALARSANRVVDLFRAWDEDKSGTVDCEEFHKAIRALGFEVERADSDAVFMSLDDDNSGSLEYKELAVMLRKGEGSQVTQRNLKRAKGLAADRSRGAKLTAKNINVNYQASRVAALPPMAKLEVINDVSIEEQLHDILQANAVKLIDLFRDWDDDGNGALDKKEMRQAIAALGYEAPKKEVDALFDSIDVDHSGWIEYEELKKALSEKGVKAAQKRIEDAARKEGRDIDRSGYEKPKPPSAPHTGRPARRAPEPPSREAQMLYARSHQICGFLAQNNVKLINLFEEWDADNNGALDKTELKKALKALGYFASPAELDDVFGMIDTSGDGLIDFSEWKRALNAFLKGQPPSPRLEPEPPGSARGIPTQRPATRAAAEGRAGVAAGDLEGVLGGLPVQENPGELIIEPRGQHTHTIIFLHPAGVKAETYMRLYRRFGNLAVHYRFVFPRAPMRVAKWHWSVGARGDGLSCWFLPMLQDQRPTFIHGFYQEAERGKEEEVAKEQMAIQSQRIPLPYPPPTAHCSVKLYSDLGYTWVSVPILGCPNFSAPSLV